MEETPRKRSSQSKWLQLLLKIAVTILCLWYVSGKIDFTKTGDALKKANWLYLFLAFTAFIFSKLLSAIRLNIYFRNINIHLSQWQNIKLYWLGMFYNLFLPGSISGDAYKVILLTKKYSIPYRRTSVAVILDRFSGLLGLGMILTVYSFIVLDKSLYITVITAGSVLSVFAFYFIIDRYFKDFIQDFFPTLLLGMLVQAVQVICVYLIMAALHIPVHATDYIFLFLISSIVSVLPLTIGGLGIREVVFLEGSKYFGLTQETAVVISLLFYLVTLATSAFGVIYVFNDPLKKEKDS